MVRRPVPELLAPAGSIDAVRAAVANGANAIYLGASQFNARDEGAQLSLDELAQACAIAHSHGARIYLTFNVLMKTHELVEAMQYLGECIDRGIDAAIVQDLGAMRLIQRVYPDLEIHGSTQTTVHDESGARVMHNLGVDRVVLARENTLDDIRAIRTAVPDLGLETFVHGALCIAYSGQCFMSGMISERSANRGSCAQSCRKDYTLNDDLTGTTLDSGYLISARDLAAHDHLDAIASAGIGCLKVEGRKKKPEYVATVTHAYREWLDRLSHGDAAPPPSDEVQPLVQIFSRGFTGGMYGGRQGRDYVTRTQPDNRGLLLGTVVGREGQELIVEVMSPISAGDGLGFEEPVENSSAEVGCSVNAVRTLDVRNGIYRQAITTRVRVADGWRVVRTLDAKLMNSAQSTFANVRVPERIGRTRVDVRAFGHAGGPLKLVWRANDHEITVRSDIPLAPAQKRSLDDVQLREQLGRLGETNFVLGNIDASGLSQSLFLPVSELNRLRQEAIEQLTDHLSWDHASDIATRTVAIAEAVAAVPLHKSSPPDAPFRLTSVVFNLDDARTAARSGATEVVFDPFLRHPSPPLARVRAAHEALLASGVSLRLRTPTIVRPDDRRALQKWLDLGLPIQSGHVGLVAELAAAGRDVTADYAVNAFNPHTSALLFELGARRIIASIELTTHELAELVAPWCGNGFDVFVYGRPEGMTIEHCVLSAAFERIPTTCRDLCVQKHTQVSITDPAGYTFPVATDSACRNRLLHSRPVDGAEYLPALWNSGIRGFQLVFNVPGDPVAAVTQAYRDALEAIAAGTSPNLAASRSAIDGVFTRGHFARAV